MNTYSTFYRHTRRNLLNIQGGAKRKHVFEMGSSRESEGRRPSLGLPQIKSLRSKTSYSR